jgi:hypothetical protein
MRDRDFIDTGQQASTMNHCAGINASETTAANSELA